MADTITIDTKGFTKGVKQWEALMNTLPDRVSDVLNKNTLQAEYYAKKLAPTDRGQLRQGISSDTSQQLSKKLTSNAPYSAYMEFGTGKYAAKYVSTLPPDYQSFARQFKGKTPGGFHEFVNAIVDWILRKGIVGHYNVKSGKRVGAPSVSGTYNTGQKGYKVKSETERAFDMAYVIILAILKKGVHPQPFMIPALIAQKKHLINDMMNLLKRLKIA